VTFRTMRIAASLVAVLSAGCARDAKRAVKVDTLSDSAAAATSKEISRAAAGTAVSMTVTGKDRYSGPLNGRATCTYGGDGRSPTTKVEALGRDAQVAFEIVRPAVGKIPVKSGADGKHPGPRISNLQFVLHSQTYGDGSGTATLSDPVGRVGSLTAGHFSRIATGKRHGSDLAITVRWECE
jgi:hypothetical protein